MSSSQLLLNSDFVNWTRKTTEATTHASWALQLYFDFDFDFGGTFTRFLPASVQFGISNLLRRGPGLFMWHVALLRTQASGKRGEHAMCLGCRKWSPSKSVPKYATHALNCRCFISHCFCLSSTCCCQTWSLGHSAGSLGLGALELYSSLAWFQFPVKWVKWRPLLFSVITELLAFIPLVFRPSRRSYRAFCPLSATSFHRDFSN